MRKLVIQNKMELLCLNEVLREYPRLISKMNAKPSAIMQTFIRETMEKISLILDWVKKGIKGKWKQIMGKEEKYVTVQYAKQ